MPYVYVLPGFLESTLDTSLVPIAGVYWPNPVRIVTGGIAPLALSPDGVTPLPPFGLAMTGGLPIPIYLSGLVTTLVDRLGPQGWTVVARGYDWRLRIETTGQALADDIAARVPLGDHATLIGHSMGGLLAQYAYGRLAGVGLGDRVRRIINVGTPSKGSYQPVLLAGDGDDMIRGVITIMQGLYGALSAGGVFTPQTIPTNDELVRVAATWPGLYELLPFAGSDVPVYDPFRPTIYDPSAWPAWVGVQPQHLAHALNVWQTTIRGAGFRPPPSVMLCVSGIGLGTYHRLAVPERLGRSGALAATAEGDGVVARDSAALPGYYEETIVSDHNSIAVSAPFLARVVTLVTMATIPVPSPTPPAPYPYPMGTPLAPPPLGQRPVGGGLVGFPGGRPPHDC